MPNRLPLTRDVKEIIDAGSMTAGRWAVVGLCFVIALLDGFDTQSIAFIGPAIAQDFKMNPADMTWVITASIIGMAIGAIGLGSFGDRFGRRKAIMIAIALFGAFSLAGAYATSPTQIIVLRFLIGLGMGGATPSVLALTGEYSTAPKRGLMITAVLLGLPAGAMLGGLIAASWLPVLGWRGIFLLGGALPLALLVVIYALLPESPAFLVSRNKAGDQDLARRLLGRMTGQIVPADVQIISPVQVEKGASIAGLFEARYRGVTLAISAIYLFNWIAWFLLLQWLPTALTTLGLEKAQAAYGTVTVNAAFIAMALPLSALLPKVDPRKLLTLMFMVGIAVAIGLGLAGDRWPVVFTLIALAGFGIGGQQLVLNYLIANAYPTQLRATATGWGIGIGRSGAIVGSAVGGQLLSGAGPSGYFMALAIPLALAAFATLTVRRTSSEGAAVPVASH
ncbi:MFS transporter [Xanthobacter sp. YC-JY1]|uniref:MFS transporter n=1 Tax=Xanthobacter sp. YC-JY1 TaxID=2419844 RepID=UPI001F007D6D|nr:MFS transporter [Xanthobacter sp. YC-JY1]UJX46201.1 MFS transporter [Xanthobacter sp. YC-JY1]